MEILILNGSPRKNGDTARMISLFRTAVSALADVRFTQIDAYTVSVHPCVDCRFCKTSGRCCFSDDMQAVHEALLRCDAVVFASPLFYGELTGRLLDLASRFQVYYLGGNPLQRRIRGGVLLAGGGNGEPDAALRTARMLCRSVGAKWAGSVMSLHTDTISVDDDTSLRVQLDAFSGELLKS